VPFLAATLLNTTVAPGDYKIPLQGLLLGNAWVAPQYQMKSYVPYLQLHGLCAPEDAAWAESMYPYFDAQLAAGNYTEAADIDNSILFRLQSKANISDPYNINDNPDPTAVRVAALQTYLSSAAVQQALNVQPAESQFVFCGSTAYNALTTDEERFAGYQLRWAIDNGLMTTMYNGELDLICDWIGTRNYTTVLGFAGQDAFNAAPNGNWTTISGQVGGLVQTA
jgi:carboxypeptidase C (cathepsin A)